MEKLEVARRQLGAAMELFLQNRDPVSVHCLACGGAEIAEVLAKHSGTSFHNELMSGVSEQELKQIRNKHWNAFKHFNTRSGEARDDEALLSGFSDKDNDGVLYCGWFDYAAATGHLPIEVQVFQIWFYALYGDEAALGQQIMKISSGLFPNLRTKYRDEQKRFLRKAIEKYRTSKRATTFKGTEKRPLLLGADLTA
jgi:hypothetical protein